MLERLKASLDPAFKALFGEVVECDTYRVRTLPFIPDMVFDIGANVGIFTRFARELWPDAAIVAVEPHKPNCERFKLNMKEGEHRCMLMQVALGKGQIYHALGAANGSGESYLSAGLGYSKQQLDACVDAHGNYERIGTRAVMLNEIVGRPGMPLHPAIKTVIKIDCEGAENVLWEDEESMEILHAANYLCLELHDYALDGKSREQVIATTNAALKQLERTHDCERQGVYFWASRR